MSRMLLAKDEVCHNVTAAVTSPHGGGFGDLDGSNMICLTIAHTWGDKPTSTHSATRTV